MASTFLKQLSQGIPLDPLPPQGTRNPQVPHAPKRKVPLNPTEQELALSNALRYFPSKFHDTLRNEFKQELENYGHIYMYRFTPDFPVKAYPIGAYPAKCLEARAIMLMITNNLDPAVAQFPQELVTYGGNGQVLSNWAQFWLVMKYLSEMDENQVLVMYSGHPMGLFPSTSGGPRVVITNGMMIPNYSKPEDYDKYFAIGVTLYGQMTAGSYCYIGPQGIVHGTTITLLNAGRKYLNTDSLKGKVFVTSGLGGMSGAQAKAAVIAGCVGVIAEVSWAALKKRHEQGWLQEIAKDLDSLMVRMKEAKKKGEAVSIGYFGNIVDLWEKLTEDYEKTHEKLVDLGSDQTSLHDPYNGGYYPVSLSYEESQKMMVSNPPKFKEHVQLSLKRQIAAITNLVNSTGMRFWDYGNAFLLEAKRAGAKVEHPNDSSRFIYPSYVEDIMGDIFSLGFGPFRWVCCSGLPEDLEKTDKAAAQVFLELLQDKDLDPDVKIQYEENLKWVREAGKHKLVVGSQARILYNDCMGRSRLATRFNEIIKSGELKGPVVISRDHHDVSGADSPFRETSNGVIGIIPLKISANKKMAQRVTKKTVSTFRVNTIAIEKVPCKKGQKKWIAFAMDGPTYDEGTTMENENSAFRAKGFWRLVGKVRARTHPVEGQCKWISLNKYANIKRSVAAGREEEEEATTNGLLAYRIARSQMPIICGTKKCQENHNILNETFFRIDAQN